MALGQLSRCFSAPASALAGITSWTALVERPRPPRQPSSRSRMHLILLHPRAFLLRERLLFPMARGRQTYPTLDTIPSKCAPRVTVADSTSRTGRCDLGAGEGRSRGWESPTGSIVTMGDVVVIVAVWAGRRGGCAC
jgi:hypothetical protein